MPRCVAVYVFALDRTCLCFVQRFRLQIACGWFSNFPVVFSDFAARFDDAERVNNLKNVGRVCRGVSTLEDLSVALCERPLYWSATEIIIASLVGMYIMYILYIMFKRVPIVRSQFLKL